MRWGKHQVSLSLNSNSSCEVSFESQFLTPNNLQLYPLIRLAERNYTSSLEIDGCFKFERTSSTYSWIHWKKTSIFHNWIFSNESGLMIIIRILPLCACAESFLRSVAYRYCCSCLHRTITTYLFQTHCIQFRNPSGIEALVIIVCIFNLKVSDCAQFHFSQCIALSNHAFI